jgi:hypothetical protein
MAEIIVREPEEVKFAHLEKGELFIHDDNLWVKLGNVEYIDGKEVEKDVALPIAQQNKTPDYIYNDTVVQPVVIDRVTVVKVIG